MKRSKFSLSNTKLATCDMGELIPINVCEVLPGDTIQQATSMLLRVSPLLAPVMHPMNVRIHHWYVPTRIIWDDFEKFITGGPDGNDNSIVPYFQATSLSEGSLYDYLGLPTGSFGTSHNICILPIRAYQKVWNEFYRDQDLQTEAVVSKASGLDGTTSQTIKYANWEKDYFTSSRPWTQKGSEVTIDVTGTGDIPIAGDGTTAQLHTASDANDRLLKAESTTGKLQLSGYSGVLSDVHFSDDPSKTGLVGDAAGVSLAAISINDLRQAMGLQRFAEARAKWGSRYTEYLRYYGIKSSDGRLERPEYLGGGKQTIQFSEILQTAPTTSGSALGVGDLKGHGIAALRTNRYRRFFEEHGYIITLMSVVPRTMYCQGLGKMWTRTTKEDFYTRELQDIGQAEILNREIYASHSNATGVFAYQDRYDEYKRLENSVHGEFRSTMNHWHLGRIFSGDPTLNEAFIQCYPSKRIHAVTNKDVLWVQAHNSIQARRAVRK